MILAHLNVERFRLKIVWNFVYNKKQIRRNFVGYSGFALFVCGEGGIRTPGGVTLNGFQDRRDRPLCHLSMLTCRLWLVCVAKLILFFLTAKFS